jgi:hypothetical protein
MTLYFTPFGQFMIDVVPEFPPQYNMSPVNWFLATLKYESPAFGRLASPVLEIIYTSVIVISFTQFLSFVVSYLLFELLPILK